MWTPFSIKGKITFGLLSSTLLAERINNIVAADKVRQMNLTDVSGPIVLTYLGMIVTWCLAVQRESVDVMSESEESQKPGEDVSVAITF